MRLAMRRFVPILALLLLPACSGEKKADSIYLMSRSPTRVRGWIFDGKGAQKAEAMEMEIARRTQLFQSTSVWVEDAQFASGGIAENGAFIVLDVPPLSATLGFNAPTAETARIVMKDVPPSADVFLPDVVLEPGGATFLDPSRLMVRLPASVSKPTPTGRHATINGHKVPIVETPVAQMVDRRDYPNPGGFRPVAVVK